MESSITTIDQALHGYRQGHELLASSVELSSSDKRKMLYLSDSSGSDFSDSFDGYLEGYPLSGDNYVLSRTWKATEMKRPGCVWTHSLIISRSDLGNLENLFDLFIHFKRPSSEDFSFYKKKISFFRNDFLSSNIEENFVDLAFSYVLSPEKQIIVQVKDKEKSEKELLGFWKLLNADQKFSLSFCAGYFSLNQPPKESFQVAFIPKTGKRFSWDKNTAIYLDDNKKLADETSSPISDDYKEIALFSFKERGLNKSSIESANQLYNLVSSGSVTNWMKHAPLLESNIDFAMKLFGPEEFRFKAVKNVPESELLKIIISNKFLREIDKMDTLKRIKSLTADDVFNVFQDSFSLEVDNEYRDFTIKLYEMLPSLQYAQFNHPPVWFMVYLISNEQTFNISSLWSLPIDEIFSVLSHSLVVNKKATINLLEKNNKVASNKKIDLWLLQNVEEDDFEKIVIKFNINVLQLPNYELQKIVSRFPLKILSIVNLDSVSENLAYTLFSNSIRARKSDLFLEKLNALESLNKINWDDHFWFEIVSHVYEYDRPISNKVFLRIYPHLIELLSTYVFKKKHSKWSDILPFNKFFKSYSPLDDLRLTLLGFVASKRVSVTDFLSCLTSENEAKELCSMFSSLDFYDRRKLRLLLTDYSGTKQEADKIYFLLRAIDDD